MSLANCDVLIQKLQASTLSSPSCHLLGKVTWATAAGPEKEVAVKNGCSVLPSSDLPSSRPLTLLRSPGWKKSKLLPYFSHLMFRSLSYSSLSRTTFPGLVLNSRKKAKPQVHKELIVYTHHLQPGLVSLAHSVNALMLFCSVNHSLLSHLRAPSHWISLLLAMVKKRTTDWEA